MTKLHVQHNSEHNNAHNSQNKTKHIVDDTLPKSVIFYYGAMGFPLAMLGIPIYLYLPQYYADEFGLSLSVIGLALLVARMFDVITDPLIGLLSDRYHYQFSRSKQVLTGLVILLFALYALFFPLVTSPSFSYLFLLSFLTYQAWTIIQVPYQTMAAEISVQPLHKTQLTSAREGMSILGVLFILIVPFALGLPTNHSDFYSFFMFSAAITLIFAGLVLFKINWLPSIIPSTIPNLNSNTEKALQTTSRASFKSISKQLLLHNRHVFSVMPAYFLNNLANALPATLFVFFVSDYLKLEQYTGIFLLIYFLAGLVALPLWIKVSKKIGKEKTWQLSMLLASLFFCLVFWLEPGEIWFFGVICVLTGLSLGIDLAIPASIQADITQQIKRTKDIQEVKGFIFGIWSMLTKLALAVAVGLSLPALDFVKTNPEYFQNSILLLYAAIPIVLKILSILFVRPHHKI